LTEILRKLFNFSKLDFQFPISLFEELHRSLFSGAIRLYAVLVWTIRTDILRGVVAVLGPRLPAIMLQ
jgi:hypothetical protein